MDSNWTAPYLNTSHLESRDRRYRATVDDRVPSFVDVSFWTPGCGFSPAHKTFPSLDEAKRAGEAFIAAHA